MDKQASAEVLRRVAVRQKNLRADIMRHANKLAREADGAQVSLGVPELAEKFNVSPEAVRSVLGALIGTGKGYHRTSSNLFIYRKVENPRKYPDRQLTAKVIRYMQSLPPGEWVDARQVARAVDGVFHSVSGVLSKLTDPEQGQSAVTHIITLRKGSGLYSYQPPAPAAYTPPPAAEPVAAEPVAIEPPGAGDDAGVEWAEPPARKASMRDIVVPEPEPAARELSAKVIRHMQSLPPGKWVDTSQVARAAEAYEEPKDSTPEQGSLHWVRLPSGKLLAEDDYGNLYELYELRKL